MAPERGARGRAPVPTVSWAMVALLAFYSQMELDKSFGIVCFPSSI